MSDERFDVLVIGGGINGVAIARECARGGKRVLILERNDFCAGVTSRSTRIIHGGLRYLEHGELGMVRESLRERERLRAERPHLVRPLKFVIALGAGGNHSALAVRAGLWLYGALGAGRPAAVDGELDRLQRLLDQRAHRRFRVRQAEPAHRRGEHVIHPVERVVDLVRVLEDRLHIVPEGTAFRRRPVMRNF